MSLSAIGGQWSPSAVDGPPVGRRQRLRAATLAEIKHIARRQLIGEGRAAISMRAIAREMGMTPAALYRYFPGVDALVERILADVHLEAAGALHEARAVADPNDPLSQLASVTRSLRRWALSNPAEFALIFEVRSRPEAGLDGRLIPAYREICLVIITELWASRPFVVADTAGAGLRSQLASCADELGTVVPLPLAVLHLAVTCYVRICGLLALEVFGHLAFMQADGEAMFEAALADVLGSFGGEAPSVPHGSDHATS